MMMASYIKCAKKQLNIQITEVFVIHLLLYIYVFAVNISVQNCKCMHSPFTILQTVAYVYISSYLECFQKPLLS